MKRNLQSIAIALSVAFFSTLACAADTYVAGKNYVDISAPTGLTPLSANKDDKTIQVVEFFSYACPHCADFDPILEKWLASKPADVSFYRIPVEWNRGWDNLAKAYYTAEQLKVTDKMNHALFEAMQNRKLDPTDVNQIAALFKEKAAISEDVFKKTFDSFGVNVAQTRGQQWTTGFKIRGVPAIVVAGRYETDAGKAGGIEELPKVIDYLIGLSKQTQK